MPNRRARICLLVEQIQSQIRSLFDVSSLLRRPRVTDKYLRSVSSRPVSSRPCPQPEPTKALSLSFMAAINTLDERHIIEKVLQWRRRDNTSSCAFLEEPSTPVRKKQDMAASEVIEDDAWLFQRLAQANTRRREQLEYWKLRPYEAETMHDEASTIKLGETSRSQKTKKTALTTTGFSAAALTTTSFSTAAFSDVHNTKTVERARTTYTPTNVGQDRVNFIPDPPKTDVGSSTFPCPYCGIELNKKEMQNRQTWK